MGVLNGLRASQQSSQVKSEVVGERSQVKGKQVKSQFLKQRVSYEVKVVNQQTKLDPTA
jgi:hypothetical protein